MKINKSNYSSFLNSLEVMEKEKFTISYIGRSKWSVCDRLTSLKLKFREGLTNIDKIKKFEFKKRFDDDNLSPKLTSRLREMADWLAENHNELVSCNISARARAIWILANEKYWTALAVALKDRLANWEPEKYAMYLKVDMKDDLMMGDQILNEFEKSNLSKSISILSDTEAQEVVCIIHAFWKNFGQIGIKKWAWDLVQWPSLLTKEQQDEAASEMHELIDEEDEEGHNEENKDV